MPTRARTTQPQHMKPRHPRNFLVLLQQEVNDPTTWVLRPGTQDNSIWKLVVTSHSPACVRQAEYAMLARVCPRSSNVATVGRQLGYWMFQKLKTGQTHSMDVEVEPGRTITLTYHQYNHAPTLSEVDTMRITARAAQQWPHHTQKPDSTCNVMSLFYECKLESNTRTRPHPVALSTTC